MNGTFGLGSEIQKGCEWDTRVEISIIIHSLHVCKSAIVKILHLPSWQIRGPYHQPKLDACDHQ